jgi:hypothetical protein
VKLRITLVYSQDRTLNAQDKSIDRRDESIFCSVSRPPRGTRLAFVVACMYVCDDAWATMRQCMPPLRWATTSVYLLTFPFLCTVHPLSFYQCTLEALLLKSSRRNCTYFFPCGRVAQRRETFTDPQRQSSSPSVSSTFVLNSSYLTERRWEVVSPRRGTKRRHHHGNHIMTMVVLAPRDHHMPVQIRVDDVIKTTILHVI